MQRFPEGDWKRLRALRDLALSRFCEQALDQASAQIEQRSPEASAHKTYLAVFETLHESDKRLSAMFDDFKRSTAIPTLMMWVESGIVSREELDTFSDGTKSLISRILDSKPAR